MVTIDIELDRPPSATAQQRKFTYKNGYMQSYLPKNVAEAKAEYTQKISKFAPRRAMTGAIRLNVCWRFKTRNTSQIGKWKITRPDTDNLNKMLKDIMSELGFWKDDSQVVSEHIEKKWDSIHGITIEVEELEE